MRVQPRSLTIRSIPVNFLVFKSLGCHPLRDKNTVDRTHIGSIFAPQKPVILPKAPTDERPNSI
ncbi:MAG: hypothetical protein ACRC62_11245 [Microcoleus sp.]